MNGGGRVNDLLFELASQGRLEASKVHENQGVLGWSEGLCLRETRDSIVRFGSGRRS